MNNLKIYTRDEILPLSGNRVGALTLVHELQFLSPNEDLNVQLKNSAAKYVLFGIMEDVGVRANYGRPGATNAWKPALRTLVNLQVNAYNQPEDMILLGHLDFSKEIEELQLSSEFNPSALHDTVVAIDKQVSKLVETIVASGKIPIAVGGGHNNAYGMIKGTSNGLKKPLNVINIDAHADLRPSDYRHSGNGFTYAKEEGFLSRYYIFGLHENYITRGIAQNMDKWKDEIKFNNFEETHIRREKDFEMEAEKALNFVGGKTNAHFGLEIDLDVIRNMPTSAMSPSGFSLEEVRRLCHIFSRNSKIAYLHLCEAAPKKESEVENIKVGKSIAYLITDFIRFQMRTT